MKKIYLIFFGAVFLIANAVAQTEKPIKFKIGINSNVSYSNLFQLYTNYNLFNQNEEVIVKPDLSYSWGIHFGVELRNNFQINTGLSYKQVAFKNDFGAIETDYSPIFVPYPYLSGEHNLGFKSISAAFSIAAKVMEQNNFRIFIETGFVYNFLLEHHESNRPEDSRLAFGFGDQELYRNLKKKVISGFTQINLTWKLKSIEWGLAPAFYYAYFPFNKIALNEKNLYPYQLGLTTSICKYF